MREMWKPVVGNPDYEVSSLGRVRRVTTAKGATAGRVLKPGKGSHGYFAVGLGRNNQRLVHRLMAEAFLPRVPGLISVNHINGIKTDNRLANLEWSNYSLNRFHALQTGLAQRPPGLPGSANLQSKLTDDDVRYIRTQHAAGVAYSVLGRELNVSTSLAYYVCKRGWKHVT